MSPSSPQAQAATAPGIAGPPADLIEPTVRVSVPMRRRAAASTTVLTASAPARCPAVRGKRWRSAQRPLPSMMIAMCIGEYSVLQS